MSIKLQTSPDPNALSWFKRPRLNQLLAEATKRPVVIVCAGAGCGKTRAVSDFLSQQNLPVAWEQLSERDNVESRTWENVTNSFVRMNEHFREAFKEVGFPETEEKRKKFYQLYEHSVSGNQQYIVVIDDFHFVKNTAVVDFVKYSINYLPAKRKSLIIISREPLPINLANLHARGLVANIYEDDLNFTERELSQYLGHMGLSVETHTVREIFQDTRGWSFAVNFIAQSLKKTPNYSGYVRSAMLKNIFQLLEMEVFNKVSERLRRFLLCISLVDHFSADMIANLAGEDKSVLAELEQQSAFVRLDGNINAYLVHHLLLDFLRAKRDILTEEEKRRTYQIAADWCIQNDFKMDALAYYEKIGDYESIVSIFYNTPIQMPPDMALYAEQIFDRAPPDTFTRVVSFAGMHVRAVICLQKVREALDLMGRYEAGLLSLPEDDALRNLSLAGLYYAWGSMRQLMCTKDDRYDFDVYFARMGECLTKFPARPSKMSIYSVGSWFSLVGSTRQGATEEYIDALARTEKHVSHCYNGCMSGIEDLARGEFKFYQGDIRSAESLVVRGIARARDAGQFEMIHKALFGIMQIAVSQGDFAKAEQALKDTAALLEENDFLIRFSAYDITLGMYYIHVLQPEMVPNWLKEKFSPYIHPKFMEHSANRVRACYCYITKNYGPLLDYIEENKKRESILYGRVELQAMKACLLFKMKDRSGAFSALREAYETVLHNSIVMPFIQLGKDMRTLASAALRDSNCAIPKPWLEMIVRESSFYAKRYAQFLFGYKRTHGVNREAALSSREREVLRYMYHGLSRLEIAARLNLSSNTIKLYINNIYGKLQARNLADVIRITAEQKLV